MNSQELWRSYHTAVAQGKIELAKIKADYESAIELMKKENTEAKAELESAKKVLENPAYKDAKAEGVSEIKSGDTKAEDLGDLEKQLSAIKDPSERMTFYRKNIQNRFSK